MSKSEHLLAARANTQMLDRSAFLAQASPLHSLPCSCAELQIILGSAWVWVARFAETGLLTGTGKLINQVVNLWQFLSSCFTEFSGLYSSLSVSMGDCCG